MNLLDTNELCCVRGWDSVVNFPTRGEALLDKVFTNRQDLFGKCAPYTISIKIDHTAVIMTAGRKLKSVRHTVHIYDCRKHRKEDFYRALDGICWDDIMNTTNVEDAVNNLEFMIHAHMNKSVCPSERCVCFHVIQSG